MTTTRRPEALRPLDRRAPEATLAAAASLAIAAIAWIYLVTQSSAMGAMAMGLGPLPAFMGLWVVMMAAMMLPSAIPFVRGQAASAGIAKWPIKTIVLISGYLAVWAVFGLAAYLVYGASGMPWPQETRAGGIALILAGLFGLLPLKRACQRRCRAMSGDIQMRPGNVLLPSLGRGLRYGVNCVGSSAAVMVALLALGMSNVVWMVVASVIVLLYKVVPLSSRHEYALSLTLGAVGMWLLVAPSTVPPLMISMGVGGVGASVY